MTDEQFDIVVVGGGPGGEACAAHAARSGARVALVERDKVGGECPYWGCMPSKALLRPPQAVAELLRTPGAAEGLTGALDVDAAFARRDEVVRHLDDTSHAERIQRRGIEIVRGHGRLDGERRVVVELNDGGRRTLVAAKAVVLAPGSRAAMPPIDGLVDANPWTNREATLADRVPTSLAILGGGVIAVELAQAYAAYGSQVTIVEFADRLLSREEPEAAQLVAEALERTGVTVRCGTTTSSVTRLGDGRVRMDLDTGETIVADELLVATGRVVNVEQLGLETVGVEPGKNGIIDVTDCMYVASTDWLFVVGDANGRAQLTHAAVYQARVAARNALGIETHCVEDNVAAARVVFTEPNLCGVGHTLQSARDAGLNVTSVDRDPQRTAAGSFYGRGTEGFTRLVVDVDRGVLVGATFVGPDISELLHSATIAIVGQVPLERLQHCVAPFPTRSEVWTRCVEAMERDELLSPALR
ncbi:MAG: family, FAD-dependent NAD(P)-disulfide oxidoreductase [Thermoleophilia bacterium]|nr:family, FAD-dependent NAD(P)-disulfide oxidoreductase [Thermoleophilia bacterium]